MSKGCNISETAKAPGVQPAAVKSRVLTYRKRGIKLPRPRDVNRNKLDVNGLNSLIKSYAKVR